MKSNTKYQWMLPLGSMVVASIIAVGAWFVVGAMKSETAVQETHQTATSLILNLYPTLGDLSESADTVILGEVKGTVHTGVSFGTDGTGGIGVPYTLYQVEVHETFKGDASGTIYVMRTDPGFLGEAPGMGEYPLTTLTVGADVVLYLYGPNIDLEPTIPSGLVDAFYTPLGFDNGVFDVSVDGAVGAVGRVNDATEVTPRGIHPSMFAEGMVFTAADVRLAIEPEPGEDGPVGSTN